MANFRYDIDVNLDDIKSPLPQRPVSYVPPEEPTGQTVGGVTVDQRAAEIPNINVPSVPKKLNNKLFLIIGVIVVVIALAVGGYAFFGKIKKTSEPIVLNYWGLWEDSSIMAGVISEYESKNPGVKINYRVNQLENYRSRLQGRLLKTGATTEEVPDIFRIHNTWIPMFRTELSSVPVQTATTIGLDTDFYSVYKEDLIENGAYKAIPLQYDGLVLFSNKDLLDAAKVEIPRSWWGLETAANKLTVKDANGKISIAGVSLGMVDNIDHWSDVLGLMMKQNGVNLLQDDEVNNKKLQDVLAFYSLFKTKDQVWDETLPNSTTFFVNGKLAFYFGPSWRIFNFEQLNPSLRFEVSPVPQLPILATTQITAELSESELTNIHWGSYWVEGVNNKSKNQKEAWKFLEYLASKEGLEKMYASASQIRSFGEIYPRKSMAAQISSNPKIKPFVTSAENAGSWYLASNTQDDGVNDEMIRYFGNAINSIVQKNSSPESVVADLRKGITQLIQKYQLIK